MSDVRFEDFLARVRAEPEPRPPARYGGYPSYRALFDRVARLRDRGATLEAIGRSTGNEPIWAIHLGAPAESARRRVLWFGNLHAQELIATESALAACDLALERIAEGDPRWDGVAVTCVPSANPDGYRQVMRDLAAGRPRFRRKNGHGVDLNRNFSEGFAPDALMVRLLPQVYRTGPRPLSEPETAALDRLFQRGYHRALSLHSFGRWIFWPWACRREKTPDEARFARLAEAMRARQAHPYRARQLARWSLAFRAGGLEIDHLYARYGTLAFLMEIGMGGRALARPSTWIDAFAWFNPRDIALEAGEAAAAALALAEEED